jgi:hypothetical protein
MTVRHDDHDTDRLVESLLVHPREELVGFVPIARELCGLCDRPSDDLLDRGFGLQVCLACRRLERSRYEQSTGRCARGCAIAPAFHPDPDRCPSENEARAMAGDR